MAAQGIHIHENAVISVGPTKKVQAVVSHTLRFVFSWDKGGGRIYVPGSPCGVLTQDVYYGGPDSVVIELSPARPGQYVFDPQYCVACITPSEIDTAIFSIYSDGVLVSWQSARFSGSEYDVYTIWPYGWIYYTTPYYNSFNFNLQSKYAFGDPYIPLASGIYNCDSTSTWSPHTDPFTLTIVSGSQYASIHRTDPQTGADAQIGSTVTTIGDSLGNFSVVFDGSIPDSIFDWVVVQASSNGITKIDSLQVLGRPTVTITPSEISTGDTAIVNVEWQNAPGGFINSYEAGIISGENYGMILTDTSFGNEGEYFRFIRTPFWFVAADSIDSDSVMVEIRAGVERLMLGSIVPGGKGNGVQGTTGGGNVKGSVVESTSKKSAKAITSRTGVPGGKFVSSVADDFVYANYGIGSVKVIRGGVKVKVTAANSTLTPLGDSDNKNNPNYNPNGPDTRKKIIDWKFRKTTPVTITVTDANNNSVPNYPFTLSAFVSPYSGGHDHNDNRPTGEFITPAHDTVATFQGTTNSDGKAAYTYICSGFGGVDSIFVKGKTDRDTSSTTILLQFPGLQELTSGDHYELSGAFGEAGVTSQHYKNHYGMPKLIAKMKRLADTVYSLKEYQLRINDMSLIDGGPFDIDNNWNTPHQTHRQGVSADISNEVLQSNGNLLPLSQRDLNKWLTYVVSKPNIGIEASHYHVTIR